MTLKVSSKPLRTSELKKCKGSIVCVALIGALLSTLALTELLSAKGAQATSNPKIYIGILDDARVEMANWEPGVAHNRIIRPAFEKVGSAWRDVDYSPIPGQMTWTVAFDGRSLGQVKSHAAPEGSTPRYSEGFLTLVQLITTPRAAIPIVGRPSQKFAGLMAMGPGKTRRPLVVVSKPYFRDRDGWKPATRLPERVAMLVRAAFRRDFPHVNRCKDEKILQHDWRFPDSSLELIDPYESNKGSFLVETSLDAGDCGYVDDPNDPLSNPWYFVSAKGNARRFGSFLTLLDAGDYDNGGRSELIFMLSQPEDTDGFILYDADLRKQASLTWSYH